MMSINYSSGSSDDVSALSGNEDDYIAPPSLNGSALVGLSSGGLLPTKRNVLTKSALPSSVSIPKVSRCKVRGKNKKCDHDVFINAIKEANNNTAEAAQAAMKINVASRTDHDEWLKMIKQRDQLLRQLRQQLDRRTKQFNLLDEKLHKNKNGLVSAKNALKDAKSRLTSVENKLKKSESAKNKLEDRVMKAEEEVRRTKNNNKNNNDQVVDDFEKKRKDALMKADIQMRKEEHKYKMKEREEERKYNMKQKKFAMMTGGGTSSMGDGTWNSKVTVRGRSRSRERSLSPSYHRKRSSSRSRSRRSRRRRHKYYDSDSSISRSSSSERHRDRKKKAKKEKKMKTKQDEKKMDDLGVDEVFSIYGHPNRYPGGVAPYVRGVEWGVNNTHDVSWVPNPRFRPTPVVSTENEAPNTPDKARKSSSVAYGGSASKNLFAVGGMDMLAAAAAASEDDGKLGNM